MATPPAPTPTDSATAPTPSTEADRYPPDLIGRPFLIRSTADPGWTILGRIGLPERIRLQPGEYLLGILGDRVVTSLDNDVATMFAIWSFTTGHRVVEPTRLPGVNWPHGFAAADAIIAFSTQPPEGIVGKVVAISVVDGSVREIVPESRPTGFIDPARSIAVSRAGTVLATTICSTSVDFMGNCAPASLVDIASGQEIRSLDLAGGTLVDLTMDSVLVSWPDHFAWRGFDGTERWTSPSYVDTRFLQGVWVLDDRTVLATVFIGGEPSTLRILAFDISTGKARAIATLTQDPGADEVATVEFELSTPTSLAIGLGLTRCGLLGLACDPEEPPVIDASAVDVASGQLTPHAIHIALTE